MQSTTLLTLTACLLVHTLLTYIIGPFPGIVNVVNVDVEHLLSVFNVSGCRFEVRSLSIRRSPFS